MPLRDALTSLTTEGRIASADAETLARVINGGLIDTALWVAASDDPRDTLEKVLGATETLLSGLAR